MQLLIKKLRKDLKGWTQADLADVTGLSRPYIGALESPNIIKHPTTEVLQRIANALDVRIGDLFGDEEYLSIAGKVGAGAQVPAVEALKTGTDQIYRVVCPTELQRTPGIVGVEVEGDSMAPFYAAGDILFYSYLDIKDGIDGEALKRLSVCEDSEGRAWVKHIKIGSRAGTYNLISLNPNIGDMADVKLKWATPIILQWPSYMARKG